MYDYRFAGTTRCYMGGPQTGKTTHLVEELAVLARNAEETTLVCCATPELLNTFKAQAAAAGIPMQSNIQFATVADIAARVIATPEARQATQRGSHVLCEYEERVLLEDMRTITMKGKRLKELLGFLYRQFSEVMTPQEWDATVEEQQVMELLYKNLNFTGGVLRYELASVALQALNANPQLSERFAWDNVIVDDYALLSRGLQLCAAAFARKTLVIASDVIGARTAPLPFPYLRGLGEFVDANPSASVVELSTSYQPAQIVQGLEHLRQEPSIAVEKSPALAGVDAQEPAMKLQEADDMGGELGLIARCVQDAQARGESVAVVGTNNIWRSNAMRALESLGMKVQLPAKRINVKDFSDEHQAARIRKDALAQLQHDSRDGVAWRTVLAAGDYVARSVGVTQLRTLAGEQGLDMLATLEGIAAGSIELGAEQEALAELAQIYEQALAELQAQAGEQGAVTATVSDDANAANTDDSSKATPSSAAVLLCRPEELFGTQVDHVVFGGFVDGLIPKRDYFDSSKILGARKLRMEAYNAELMHMVLGRANKSITFTAFTHASLPVAERLELRIDRIYFKEGMRACKVHASSLKELIGV